MNFFKNRKLLIATKHGKESVLKPLLEESLKVECFLNTEFDTDFFGTFDGKIKRHEDALTTLRNKCLAAMTHHHCDLAVASEGSFGPHPAAFFATADDELVILIDLKNDIEVIGRKVALDTNFADKECGNLQVFLAFLEQIKFPSHKVILKDKATNPVTIYKDFTTEAEAVERFHFLLEKNQIVFAETDMRAMNNPTRMNVIKEAAENLIEKLHTSCPSCSFPGFSVTSSVPGLQCSCCNAPTKSILYTVYSCFKCNFQEKKYYPRDLKSEDPMYCDRCNP